MKIGKFEFNFSIDNQWLGLRAFWNKSVRWNWYDMTLIQLNADYINYKRIDKTKTIKMADKPEFDYLRDLMQKVDEIQQSIEINIGLVGFVFTFTGEKLK
ncbi:MAG TPA: hypothetical protein PLV67_06025 [Methanofastidiosum sp.]|jgi:hypothetical protein|nr:hypothetical protein [Methanofastidiosum sp.]